MRRLALILSLSLTGCLEPVEPTTTKPAGWEVQDQTLRDPQGRHTLLRGINARVEGLFDVTFDDGRVALEEIPPFTGDDCSLLARELGMNFLRLPVNWSGLEPERGQYNQLYINHILTLVTACGEAGIVTLVDLHQDAWSKHIGEDGAPLWAIIPPPTELLEGPLDDLGDRRASAQALQASASFFDNVDGIRDAYAAMAAHLAQQIAANDYVVGLELMNEPVLLLSDPEDLDEFHRAVVPVIRERAPNLPIWWEPDTLRNLTDKADVSDGFPDTNAVYAPHMYTNVFESGWTAADITALTQSMRGAADEARELGMPWCAGEYGHDPKLPEGLLYISLMQSLMDEHLACGAVWVYEEYSQGSWGLYNPRATDSTRGTLRPDFMRTLAHPYPQQIAGTLLATAYDSDARTLTVDFEPQGDGLAHLIAAPQYAQSQELEPQARCAGTEVPISLSRLTGRLAVSCDRSPLVITYPQPVSNP